MGIERNRLRQVNDSTQRKDALGDVVWTVGVEATNAITVSGQAKDEAGNDMAEAVAFSWYWASDAAGLNPIAAAHDGGTAAGTDGSISEDETTADMIKSVVQLCL